MYLSLVISVLLVTAFTASAQADISSALAQRAANSGSTSSSRIKRRCPLETEEDPNPYCRPPTPPPPPPDPSVHSYTINDPAMYQSPISIKITVPDTLTVETWNDVLLSNLQTTLPITLKQFNVDAGQIAALAEEGLPLLVEAITAVQSGLSLPDADSELARRGLFSRIGNWLKKVSCSPSLQTPKRQC